MLYGSEYWTVNKADVQRIDVLDQWCLQWILNIHWHDFVRNVDVWCLTEQPRLSSNIRSRRFSLFGHFVHMDVTADANQILFTALEKTPWSTMLDMAQEYLGR